MQPAAVGEREDSRDVADDIEWHRYQMKLVCSINPKRTFNYPAVANIGRFRQARRVKHERTSLEPTRSSVDARLTIRPMETGCLKGDRHHIVRRADRGYAGVMEFEAAIHGGILSCFSRLRTDVRERLHLARAD